MISNIFILLLNKMLPLYFMILMGYIASRVLQIKREHISKLLIYIIAPVVIFYGVYSIEFKTQYLWLPLIFFTISTSVSFLFFALGKLIWKKNVTKSLLALSAGTGNTGYFGLPIIFALFGVEALSIGIFIQMGMTLFENSLGFYILARGHHSITESIRKISRLPVIYAFFIGILLSYFEISLGSMVKDTFEYFRGAYSLFGMMIIGMGLATVRIHTIDLLFVSLALLGRIIVWPILIAVLIILDRTQFHFFDKSVYQVAVMMAIVPLAANLVVYATKLKVFPEKAALAVLISTLLALIYIPLVVNIVFNN